MTRKTKEEKELREWIKWVTCDLPDNVERKFAFVKLTALVRAVREDCAKVAENYDSKECRRDLTTMKCACGIGVATEIRKGGR